ncbi:hypothetical protein LQV05_000115 [Cryptococcus neoformans]|nr:hypothetical protein LQV05_000115 [Cryptococcus neoformans]
MPPPLSQVPGPFSICTEQPPPPAAGGRRTTVSLHPLADAALADASRRPQLARSPSSIALPPISTLLPAASAPAPASKSSAQKLPPRSQAASSQPFVKGWAPATFSPKHTSAPATPPRTHAVHRPVKAQIHSPTLVPDQHVPLEYNVRRYTRADSSDRPLSSPQPQSSCCNTAPAAPPSRPPFRENAPVEQPMPMPQPHPQAQLHRRYPLQGLQLDKTYPEWSIHGWHEDAQRLLQPPRALTPSVYVKSRSISHGSYSSGSEFDKPSRPHAPPGWRDTVHGTSKPYAPPSHQVNTLYPPPHRPINSEAKPRQRSYRFITHDTVPSTKQENHARARALGPEKQSNGPQTKGGGSSLGKKQSIASAPSSPPSCHPIKGIVLSTSPTLVITHETHMENKCSTSSTWSTDHPASRLNITTYRSNSHQSSQSPITPKAAFENELDSTSNSSSSSSEPSEYEDDGFELSDMSDRGHERGRALVHGVVGRRENIGKDESGKHLSAKLYLTVPPSYSTPIGSSIKSIGSENVTPSSSNYTPTSSTKRARILTSTSTSNPMSSSPWDAERENGVLEQYTSDNTIERTSSNGGKVRQKEQRRNRERRREQNAVAQKKFRWKKKQMAEKVSSSVSFRNSPS